MRSLLKVFLIVIMFTSFTLATRINVPADQPTIQDGIDAAIDGDTVLVQPGTYDEHISFNGNNIVVGSMFIMTGDPSYISNTVIDANGEWGVVWFGSGNDSNTMLTGFTITNGDLLWGGGIFCSRGSSPTLKNLIVSGNRAEFGGGIYCSESNANLVNVTISDNKANYLGLWFGGGGIMCWKSEMNLVNVTISGNSAAMNGGGIFCRESKMHLVNVTISGNSATNSGGGIEYLESESEMILANTIVWNNSRGEIPIYDGDSVNAFYSNIKGGWPGIRNINADPMFADTANGDYRLLEGSPCIDKGIQDTMIVYNDGQDTIFVPAMDYMGSAPDIGAFESDPDNPLTKIEKYSTLPSSYNLNQNYPNPFNPSTKIKFALPKLEIVKIEVYNTLGQRVEILLNQQMQAGQHEIEFNAQNLSSGIYYYRIEAGEFQDVKKMVLIR